MNSPLPTRVALSSLPSRPAGPGLFESEPATTVRGAQPSFAGAMRDEAPKAPHKSAVKLEATIDPAQPRGGKSSPVDVPPPSAIAASGSGAIAAADSAAALASPPAPGMVPATSATDGASPEVVNAASGSPAATSLNFTGSPAGDENAASAPASAFSPTSAAVLDAPAWAASTSADPSAVAASAASAGPATLAAPAGSTVASARAASVPTAQIASRPGAGSTSSGAPNGATPASAANVGAVSVTATNLASAAGLDARRIALAPRATSAQASATLLDNAASYAVDINPVTGTQGSPVEPTAANATAPLPVTGADGSPGAVLDAGALGNGAAIGAIASNGTVNGGSASIAAGPASGAAAPGDAKGAGNANTAGAPIAAAVALASAVADKHVHVELPAVAGLGAGVDVSGIAQAGGIAQTATTSANGAAAVAPVVLQIHPNIDSNEFSHALTERVSWMVDNGVSSVKLQVNPPQLGPIELSISVQGDRAQVMMMSHSALTRDALEASSPQLKDMLSSQGFGQVSIDVSQRSFQERAHHSPPYELWAPNDRTVVGVAGAPGADPPGSVTSRAQSSAANALDTYA